MGNPSGGVPVQLLKISPVYKIYLEEHYVLSHSLLVTKVLIGRILRLGYHWKPVLCCALEAL